MTKFFSQRLTTHCVAIKIILTILAFGVVSSGCILKNTKVSEDKEQPVVTDEREDIDISNWQTYRNEEVNFFYKCPNGWTLGIAGGGYGDGSRCTMFDEGVSIILRFVFVPQEVLMAMTDTCYESRNESCWDYAINDIKIRPNAKPYSIDSFNGWIATRAIETRSPEDDYTSTSMRARQEMAGDWYEVFASIVVVKEDEERYRQIVEEIISTFKFIK